MKLASLKQGLDGRLVVVSRDLKRAVDASAFVPTLQSALDDWAKHAAELHRLSEDLEEGLVDGFAFEETACASPLSRAYQWADGSAYVNHVDLVRRARGDRLPERFWSEPLMYQGGSDAFLSPREPITGLREDWGVDFEGEIAVIVGAVPLGASREEALDAVRLVMLANDVSLRNLIPSELGKGFGFFQSKPSSAFSPVAVTPDELGDAWHEGRLNLPLVSTLGGTRFGEPNAGVDMTFDFGTLIAHAARSRRLAAGTIVGSGTVSNRSADGGPGDRIEDGGVGYSCVAELRMVETIRPGAPTTPFLKDGDTVRIEMLGADGCSIFGAIEQRFIPSSNANGAAA